MKITYCKHPNNCFYQLFSPTKKISVDLYDFNTGIRISNYKPNEIDVTDDMIECSKLEFDKAFNLALALISNKSLNTDKPWY